MPQKIFRGRSHFWLLAALFIASGCGYYSFKGALPSDIKTIAIPLFDDRTPNPGVRENLTNMVIDQFIADNTLKVVDESKADLLLTGAITSIVVQPAVVRSGEVVSESKVVVSVRIKCEDIKRSKKLFEQNIQRYGLLDASAGLDERDAAIQVALDEITEDIVNATLGMW